MTHPLVIYQVLLSLNMIEDSYAYAEYFDIL